VIPPPSPLLVLRMRGLGMRIPVRTYMAARHTGLSLALGCAVLMQESGGGINEFGHDPTIYAGAGTVTKTKYLAYRAERDRTGKCQGVGPMQLTSKGYQDQADQLGGCWRPLRNLWVGFSVLATNIRRDGLHDGVRAYNGSGPAAEQYAYRVIARAEGYAARLRLPPP
jgi:hypothetical protein